MMYEIPIVASGVGWEIHSDNGELHLHIRGDAIRFTASPKSLTVNLPPEFVKEFTRSKKDLRAAEEKLQKRPCPKCRDVGGWWLTLSRSSQEWCWCPCPLGQERKAAEEATGEEG